MLGPETLHDHLGDLRTEVEEALVKLVDTQMDGPAAAAMALSSSILLAGGKRWRPVLTLLAHEAGGGVTTAPAMDLALAFELIHTATLIHDDLNDGGKLRRGVPTLHTTHGNAEAIIAGDHLFVLGFGLGGRYDRPIVDAVSATCANIAAAELKQLRHIGDIATSPEDYYSIIEGKTAGPFETSCRAAGIVAGADKSTTTALAGFGLEVGLAFQIVDDLLDLTGDEAMGKPRGTDVHEGKMTLPLIHALTMLHGVQRVRLSEILAAFNDNLWDELTALLESAGSFQYTHQLVDNHLGRALDYISKLPESPARRMMEELSALSVGRRS
jgi:octaprenyl-diphosphate synthase